MIAADRKVTEKPIVVYNRPPTSWVSLNVKELWQYRELLYFLTWRDIAVRYKQTALGIAWAILQPLLATAIFTVIFGTFAKFPSDDVPYSMFAYVALVPWNYVSQSLSRSSEGVVSNRNLVTKVYFPRLIIPLSTVLAPLVDFALSFVILLGLMLLQGITLSWRVVFLPAFMLLAILAALSVCLWFSAANVKYRDIRYVVPFVIQVWMYASPVVYPTAIVPEQFRYIYGLNPLTGIIDGFRWALLGTSMPDLGMLVLSASVVMALLLGGLAYFSHMENSFADII